MKAIQRMNLFCSPLIIYGSGNLVTYLHIAHLGKINYANLATRSPEIIYKMQKLALR